MDARQGPKGMKDIGELIFQMKQLAALAIREEEKLYIETRGTEPV